MANDVPVSHPRQKRVLPSRSRRGGPWIGSCDVDLMILDAQKRRFDNEPLIPANTSFLLTTNSSLLQSSSESSGFRFNTFANQRYFDQPDVIKAYREQFDIQTPEFSLLSEDATVGGRFRPRSGEQGSPDTSDAIYEKRHRKYEIFEKRQRLREKEKLKHEQYKLKERIEQLRVMDGSAFLGLPATSFSPPPVASEDMSGVSLPSAPSNGGMSHDEGERRREEMLEVASILEERYRTLLPSEKKLADLRTASTSTSLNVQSETRNPAESHSSGRELSNQASPISNAPSIILKIKVPQSRYRDHGSHPISHADSGAKSKFSPHLPLSPVKPFSMISSGTSASSDRPHKRCRADSLESPHTPEHVSKLPHLAVPKAEPCVLMQWALRNQASLNTRKTQRHVTAFGTKVPLELEEVRDFELPEWIRPGSPKQGSHDLMRFSDLPTEPSSSPGL